MLRTISSTRARRSVWIPRAGLLALVALTGCPIQRPPVPGDYYAFRARLEQEVRDTALARMADRPPMQERLRSRLTELAAILQVDSLVALLSADGELRPLGRAVEATVLAELAADRTAGDVRKAYKNAHGQRLAVDAIVVGLGRALRRLRPSSSRVDRPRDRGPPG